jgi:hypothetical protein
MKPVNAEHETKCKSPSRLQVGGPSFTHDRRDYRRIAAEWANSGRMHHGIVLSNRAWPAEVRRWLLDLFNLHPDGIDGLFLTLPLRRET